jgi:hypothetical protein
MTEVVMDKIAPGMYVDSEQTLHLDIPEMLSHYGYEDNPVNRLAMVSASEDLLQEQFPEVRLAVTEAPITER